MAAPTSIPDISVPARDPEYYFEGRYIIFNVEGCLFRIPSRKLAQHSTGFKNMLEIPIGEVGEGDTDEKPIIIPQEKAAVFRHAMQWVFQDKLPDHTQEEWEALFRFSNKWGFDNLEQHCLNEMKKFDWDPWKQLAFRLEFDLPYTWAHHAFVELCRHDLEDSKSSVDISQAIKVGRMASVCNCGARHASTSSGKRHGGNAPSMGL
ncbi:hypothetical protein BT96DRAFT_1016628 [Gymnopus androsaceus JB14]|uniref:Uncharacterized protein n=1 Tax=Gymnopus androsaceus JB14 TaxID=1447944 RepID=A0A6A4I3P5_9AGAR|nr:hypothetical protein BT96DRAFT_1016628 [Gymnopus androsaceus JB14]